MAPWLRFLFQSGFLPAGFALLGAGALLFLIVCIFAPFLKDRG
jgi:hypothetical protein